VVVEVDVVVVRRVDEGVAVAAEHALDRRALVRDRPVAVDHRDHVTAVLDERAEPSLAAIELRCALADALFEMRGERQVLEQHRHLADHREQDEGECVPSEEAPDSLAEGEAERRAHDGQQHGHVRHHHRKAIGNHVVGTLRLHAGGAAPREEDRGEGAEPADVDQAARGVRAAVREVHETAVGDGERKQTGEQQWAGHPARIRAV
jgi:hypothetical protein